jgi:hypothetical protein
MTHPVPDQPLGAGIRLQRLFVALPAGVALVGVAAGAAHATSLVVAGSLLVGWSQLVGL